MSLQSPILLKQRLANTHSTLQISELYSITKNYLTVGQRAINSSEFNALCFQHVQQLQLWL